MLQEEKVKIYQLSKPIVDILYKPIYKLNNSLCIPFDVSSNLYGISDINDDCDNNILNQTSKLNFDNYDDCCYLSHPIYHYHNQYFMDFPIRFFDHNIFNNYNKSYQINYNLNHLSNKIVNTYDNSNLYLSNYFNLINKLKL